jgi:hypothetical protein
MGQELFNLIYISYKIDEIQGANTDNVLCLSYFLLYTLQVKNIF